MKAKRLIKIFILYTLCTSCFMLVACYNSNPQNILRVCIDATLNNNYKEAYFRFSFEDRSTKSLAEYVEDNELNEDELKIVDASRVYMSYDIKNLSVAEDTAKAIVKITLPDIMVERFMPLFYEIHRNKKIDSLPDPVAGDKQYYMSAVTGLVILVKEHEGWRVCGNWEEQRKREAEESKIRYEYIQNQLKIKNIKIREYKGDRGSDLTVTIKNKGQMVVRDVEILVVCLNKYDKACYIVTAHPVSTSTKPLKPEESRKIKIDLTNVPSDWSKRVEIKVTNCKFL